MLCKWALRARGFQPGKQEIFPEENHGRAGMLGAGRVENGGGQDSRPCENRSLGKGAHLIKNEERARLEDSGHMATKAWQKAVAVLISFDLANRRACHRHQYEEGHHQQDRYSQVWVFSPAF